MSTKLVHCCAACYALLTVLIHLPLADAVPDELVTLQTNRCHNCCAGVLAGDAPLFFWGERRSCNFGTWDCAAHFRVLFCRPLGCWLLCCWQDVVDSRVAQQVVHGSRVDPMLGAAQVEATTGLTEYHFAGSVIPDLYPYRA